MLYSCTRMTTEGKRSHRCWTECYASSLLQQCTVPRVNLILYIKQ